jgi:hypothetical protein
MKNRKSRKEAATILQSVFLMRGVRIDRLSLDTGGLMFSLVKRRDTESERTDTVTKTVTKFTYRYPTPAQLYALEQSARLERSRAQARLLRAGVSAVKALFARAFSRATDIQRQVARHA